ncbi:MAG: methyltransferase domain-containing protein, partial [Gemmatimonadota bacterium]|nr:methyltransferase domain-containing protein [Gemmatimonadota bacterium]
MMGPARVSAPERMDDPGVDGAELAVGLEDLRAVNRWMGGGRVVLRHLVPMLRRLPEPSCSLLDVGTGSGDIPLMAVERARREGVTLRATATDIHPATLALAARHTAAEPLVVVERADALALPYPDGTFDFAVCCAALHHFDGEEAVQALRELGRGASRGVIVSDLERSRTALASVQLLAHTLWRSHPITRHDGPVS